MKLVLLLAVLSTAAFSNTFTHERFYRAEAGQVLVQGWVSFIKLDGTFDTPFGSADIESSSTIYIAEAQYGINDNIAVGTTNIKSYSNGEDGFQDHQFFIKGQFNNLMFKATYLVSLDDSKDDNFYSGGNSVDIEGGLQINESLGLSANFSPRHEVKLEDGETEDSSAELKFGGHFENKLSNNIIGIRADYYTIQADDSDDDDTNYLILGAYANFKVSNIEFVPFFNYFNYLGENDDLDLTVTELSLQARLRF